MIADPRWPSGDGVQVNLLRNAVAPLFKPRFTLGDTEWPELGLHSCPYPCLLCVLEGEADIRIGTVPAMTQVRKETVAKQGVCVFSLPSRSCLIVPAGVPYSDGKTPHWERPQPENAHSQILWLQILPTGAIVHICRTAGTSHTHISAVFIKDTQLSVLMQLMLEETESSTRADAILLSYLATLLLCVDRNWASSHIIEARETTHFVTLPERRENMHLDDTGIFPDDSQDAALERACRYIQSHLPDAISPGEIARASYVSVPQLKRIFRAQLDTPIMKYVTSQRIEAAKTLLQRTDLTIEEIGKICGYPHRTHFSRVFKASIGFSPQAFRSINRTSNRSERSS